MFIPRLGINIPSLETNVYLSSFYFYSAHFESSLLSLLNFSLNTFSDNRLHLSARTSILPTGIIFISYYQNKSHVRILSLQRWSFGKGLLSHALQLVQGRALSVQKGCPAGNPRGMNASEVIYRLPLLVYQSAILG